MSIETKPRPSRKLQPWQRTTEYESWIGARQRCNNPNNWAYKWYGGRGITVCLRWRGAQGFANFMADMGPKPTPQHSLDRINNDGDYGPENCCWSTRAEQNRNRSESQKRYITAFGETKRLYEWAQDPRCLVKNNKLISSRIRAGWSPEDAISRPRQEIW